MEEFSKYIQLALENTKYVSPTLSGINPITLKPYQFFTSRIFSGLNSLSSMLYFYDTGFGKTLTVIHTIKTLHLFYNNWKILIIVKASLIDNPWMLNIIEYIPDILSNIKIINYDDPSFHKNIFSYTDQLVNNVDNSRVLIVIDEVHNFISRCIPKQNKYDRLSKQVYNNIFNIIHNSSNFNKLLLLTATPLNNRIESEFYLLINLLRNNPLPNKYIFRDNVLLYTDELIDNIAGICSYQKLNEDLSYESSLGNSLFCDKYVNVIRVEMSPNQTEIYTKAKKYEHKNKIEGFKTLTRLTSMIVYNEFKYKGSLSQEEYDKMTKAYMNDLVTELSGIYLKDKTIEYIKKEGSLNNYSNDEDFDNNELELYTKLYSYSCKFITACNIILKSKGKCIIYQPFTEGINALKLYLKIYKISYIEYSSKTIKTRTNDLNDFNKDENADGDLIKVLILSAAGSEGITCIGINDIIVTDTTWTESAFKQLIGRARRLNSHASYTVDRRYLNVHIILAIAIDTSKNIHSSVDEEMFNGIKNKAMKSRELCNVFKTCSIENIYDMYKTSVPYSNEDNLKELINRKIELNPVTIKKHNIEVRKIFYLFVNDEMMHNNIKIGYLNNDIIYDDAGIIVGYNQTPAIIKIIDDKIVYVINNKLAMKLNDNVLKLSNSTTLQTLF